MPTNPAIPIRVTIAAGHPPRNPPPPPGTPVPPEQTFAAQSFVGSFAWGSSPGTATIVYVGSNAVVQTGSFVTVQMGAHTFYGVCKSDTESNSAQGGLTRTLQYVDLREFLTWDYAFGAFNKPDVRLVGGVRKKRYRHLFPWSFNDYAWSYTDAPLHAWVILREILQGPTIGSPWTWDLTGNGFFTPLMNVPVYDFDFSGGERLDSVLNRLSQELGLVYGCLSIGKAPYHLVWTRKGYGTLSFPATADDKREGVALSGNATNVRVLGDRNVYQYLDLTLVKDWQPAWEQFLTRDRFAEDIFNRGKDPKTNIRYNAILGDTEQYLGRFKAAVRARTITVREYVDLRNAEAPNSGTPFIDTRLFTGRSRMDMPAVLYIEALVFRAFKVSGLSLPEGWDITSRMVSRVSINNLTTGDMLAHPGEQADGNGLAIAKGYNVSADLFRAVKSDQWDLNAFKAGNAIWQATPFQIDNSGEGARFIVFDEPVFTAENLIVEINGLKVINAAFTFAVPEVKAALTYEGELFSYLAGTYPNVSRDLVVPAQGVHQEFIVKGGVLTEIAFADGSYANDKADELATAALLRQYAYIDGGYVNKWDPATPVTGFGTQLSSLIDRVQISISPEGGTVEAVDFTTERQRDNFEPERDLDRKVTLDVLFPGQAELRQEADDFEKLGKTLEQAPDLRKNLNDILGGGLSIEPAPGLVWLPGAAGTLPAGSIIRKQPTTAASYNVGTTGVHPAAATGAHNVFVGVTLRANENAAGSFRVANAGVAPCLVQGPVNENDTVGLPTTGVNYLIKDGTPSVGRVQQKITDTSVRLILVQLGVGGAGGGDLPIWR